MRHLALATVLLAAACSSESDPAALPDAGPGAVDGGADAGPVSDRPCPRTFAPADRPRKVVVSHSLPEPTFEILELSVAGELSQTGTTFPMAKTGYNEIVFTPDGEVGIAVNDDGTLGVFRFDGDGAKVKHQNFEGEFYAEQVVIAPEGNYAYIVDPSWRKDGGGIYAVVIGCDGTLTNEGMVLPSKSAQRLLPRGPGQMVLAADDVLDSPSDKEAHLLSWSETEQSVIASVDAFADEDTIISAAALNTTGTLLVIGDTALGAGNRVSAMTVSDNSFKQFDQFEVEDPFDLVFSPFGDSVLIVSGFGDAFFQVSYNGQVRGEITEVDYVGSSPQLPARAVVINRGSLKGRVLVAENVGVHQLDFHTDGSIEDLGALYFGEGGGAVTYAIGVQP